MSNPKDLENKPIGTYDSEDAQEDYRDIEIDLISSSRDRKLGGNDFD